MAIKMFDLNRLVKLERADGAGYSYIYPDDIVGISMYDNEIDEVFITGGSVDISPIDIYVFEAEVERAVNQRMNDQNDQLREFKQTLADELVKAKAEQLFNKTDKVSDAN